MFHRFKLQFDEPLSNFAFNFSSCRYNEGAIKFARKFQVMRAAAAVTADAAQISHATDTVSFSNSFHGRTLGALNLTWKQAYKTPFAPLAPGHSFAVYGDLESARAAIGPPGKTAAVFIEPVQGEGGIFPADQAFLQGLRQICDDTGALLVFDEVRPTRYCPPRHQRIRNPL